MYAVIPTLSLTKVIRVPESMESSSGRRCTDGYHCQLHETTRHEIEKFCRDLDDSRRDQVSRVLCCIFSGYQHSLDDFLAIDEETFKQSFAKHIAPTLTVNSVEEFQASLPSDENNVLELWVNRGSWDGSAKITRFMKYVRDKFIRQMSVENITDADLVTMAESIKEHGPAYMGSYRLYIDITRLAACNIRQCRKSNGFYWIYDEKAGKRLSKKKSSENRRITSKQLKSLISSAMEEYTRQVATSVSKKWCWVRFSDNTCTIDEKIKIAIKLITHISSSSVELRNVIDDIWAKRIYLESKYPEFFTELRKFRRSKKWKIQSNN